MFLPVRYKLFSTCICFFLSRAVAEIVYGNPELYQLVRNRVAHHLLFEDHTLIPETANPNEYVAGVRLNMWAGQPLSPFREYFLQKLSFIHGIVL